MPIYPVPILTLPTSSVHSPTVTAHSPQSHASILCLTSSEIEGSSQQMPMGKSNSKLYQKQKNGGGGTQGVCSGAYLYENLKEWLVLAIFDDLYSYLFSLSALDLAADPPHPLKTNGTFNSAVKGKR